MIGPRAKPRPLACASFQPTLGAFGAFTRELSLSAEVPPIDMVSVGVAEQLTRGERGRNDNATVAANDLSDRRLGRRYVADEGEQQAPSATVVFQNTTAIRGPFRVPTQLLMADDAKLDAIAQRRKRHALAIGTQAHRAAVVRDGKALRIRTGHRFVLRQTGTSAGNGAHREPLNVTNKLRLEPVLNAQCSVDRVMQVDRALDVVFPGIRTGIVIRGRHERSQVVQPRRLLGRDSKLDPYGTDKFHAHVCTHSKVTSQVNCKAAPPPPKGRGFRREVPFR